jgi:hypothetical protein
VKLEQVLVQQLYNHKKITLQGIGNFILDSSLSLPIDSERGVVIPENAVTFEYNPKAGEDEGLINAISQHTKKIKPLASADLDSFLMLGKQFLNIGTPFTIEGLGTLDKAQTGELVFTPGKFITPKIQAPKALKENETEEKSGLFTDYNSEIKSNNLRTVLIIVSVLILGVAAWAVYHFFYKEENASGVNDTKSLQINDSSALPKDTSLNSSVDDNYTFKIVFKETTNKEEALNTLKKYSDYGHKIIMYTHDSIVYKLAEPFTLPLSDTTRIKDSLNKYYYVGEGRVETKN